MKFYHLFILLFFVGLFSCNPTVKRIPVLKEDNKGKTILNKDGSSCIVSNDMIDQITGIRYSELQAVQLFSYTHNSLRQYYSSEPFMVCEAGMSRIGKDKYFVNFYFIINTRHLQINYQGISEGSMLQLKLVNGENIYLMNILDDRGQNISQHQRLFKSSYPIPPKEMKKLRKNEIVEMGVIWREGVESYDIHQIDLLLIQYDCLSKIR